jgi:acetyl-CoA carboxylase biotin carboxyl carrier protein
VDLQEIRKLIQLVKRTKIGELEVSEGGRTVRIAAWPAGAPANPQAVATPPVSGNSGQTAAPTPTPAVEATSQIAEDERLAKIVSPMVGTFYRAPAPDADPYVEIGKAVDVGQTVCIIEAMKLMNEIESEVRGRVVKIAAENGQPVEYGQLLYLIDPQG